MMIDGFLSKALFISLTVHTILICSSWLMHLPKDQAPKRIKGVEIAYRPTAPKKKAVDVKERPIQPVQQLDLKNNPNVLDNAIPLKASTMAQALSKDFMMRERRREQIRPAVMTHKVAIRQINAKKINDPAYDAYSDMVRNRIKGKVYENFSKMEAGVVYLTFVLNREGALIAAQVIEDKTNASDYLKEFSLRSLKEAQFPPFLKGMSLPESTFNIEIQYQLKD